MEFPSLAAPGSLQGNRTGPAQVAAPSIPPAKRLLVMPLVAPMDNIRAFSGVPPTRNIDGPQTVRYSNESI